MHKYVAQHTVDSFTVVLKASHLADAKRECSRRWRNYPDGVVIIWRDYGEHSRLVAAIKNCCKWTDYNNELIERLGDYKAA